MLIELFAGIWGDMVHFYGNNGVCVFKYLVTTDDPQKLYSLLILVMNFSCFIVISVSYIIINITTSQSSAALSCKVNKQIRNRNRKLQAKISAIILTDFLCWIPFTVVCFLHYGGLIDASSWYPVFSIIILPINSVINPLLYDSTIISILYRPISSVWRVSSRTVTSLGQTLQTQTVPIEPEMIEITEKHAAADSGTSTCIKRQISTNL